MNGLMNLKSITFTMALISDTVFSHQSGSVSCFIVIVSV